MDLYFSGAFPAKPLWDHLGQSCAWRHCRHFESLPVGWIGCLQATSGQSGFTYGSKHLDWWHGRYVHMAPHEEGMVNMKNTRGGITVGNGEVMVAKKTGDIPCELCDRLGNMLHTGKKWRGVDKKLPI
jgi:hypothetical protein